MSKLWLVESQWSGYGVASFAVVRADTAERAMEISREGSGAPFEDLENQNNGDPIKIPLTAEELESDGDEVVIIQDMVG